LKNLSAALLCCFIALTGCSNALRWHPDYYTVRSGDTLYSIAMRYDLDARDLAAWNRLGDGAFIRQGQKLHLKPAAGYSAKTSGPASRATRKPPSKSGAALPAPSWRWPTNGAVVLRYGASSKTQSGIRIAGKEGQAVTATAGGDVVYAGTGLKSYGQLLIIKHNETWLSAYGFNDRLLVVEGDRVNAGQKIATMGSDSAGRPLLHFEIRRNGQPVNPQRYLPKR
jgi:lipoprotein NlpD